MQAQLFTGSVHLCMEKYNLFLQEHRRIVIINLTMEIQYIQGQNWLYILLTYKRFLRAKRTTNS